MRQPPTTKAIGDRVPKLSDEEKIGILAVLGLFALLAIIAIATEAAGADDRSTGLVLTFVAVGVILIGFISWAVSANKKNREARSAASERQRKARALREKKQRVQKLGARNAKLVESALAAVKKVSASEAARTGWLGDVDFTADLGAIVDNFEKAHELHQVVGELSALDKPNDDDQRLLAEATATAARLAKAAIERVELLSKCADEASLIDQSLRDQRNDAQTAAQRAELNAKLSALLYGIEATKDTTPSADSSAVGAVMSRVEAYREVQRQIEQARIS